MTGEIAVGIKVFSRVNKLRNLLKSIEDTAINTVYIADDGEVNEDKSDVYNGDYSFDLIVYDLPYDAGLGQGRAHIVDNLSEEYLLIVDSDHELIGDITVLRDQLEANENLGGIGGLLYENKQIIGTCHDLYENGDILIRNTREPKDIHLIADHPFVPFDFIPNVALFKRSCLQDYCWDPEYVIGKEHLDFYVGHKQRTNWQFGICPTVLFQHSPGGSDKYVRNRDSYRKLQESRSYFLDKWGYEQILIGHTDWQDPNVFQPPWKHLLTDILKGGLLASPEGVQKLLMQLRNFVRARRSLRPI